MPLTQSETFSEARSRIIVYALGSMGHDGEASETTPGRRSLATTRARSDGYRCCRPDCRPAGSIRLRRTTREAKFAAHRAFLARTEFLSSTVPARERHLSGRRRRRQKPRTRPAVRPPALPRTNRPQPATSPLRPRPVHTRRAPMIRAVRAAGRHAADPASCCRRERGSGIGKEKQARPQRTRRQTGTDSYGRQWPGGSQWG